VLTVHPTDAGEPHPASAVLIPTDFSEDAELALEAATRLVGPAGRQARVVLLHAYHLPIEIAAPYPAPILEGANVIAKSAEEHLERSAKSLRSRGIAVETMAKQGHPSEVILEVAALTKVDLIAMGTHGRSSWKRLFLGSTAERVLPTAPCPVLTVRRHDEG
jgi:nucleotide-binding universal stress UspA family protein